MKKRLLSTILATAMVFSLTACGTTNETQQAPAAEQEAPAADAAENENRRKHGCCSRNCYRKAKQPAVP